MKKPERVSRPFRPQSLPFKKTYRLFFLKAFFAGFLATTFLAGAFGVTFFAGAEGVGPAGCPRSHSDSRRPPGGHRPRRRHDARESQHRRSSAHRRAVARSLRTAPTVKCEAICIHALRVTMTRWRKRRICSTGPLVLGGAPPRRAVGSALPRSRSQSACCCIPVRGAPRAVSSTVPGETSDRQHRSDARTHP